MFKQEYSQHLTICIWDLAVYVKVGSLDAHSTHISGSYIRKLPELHVEWASNEYSLLTHYLIDYVALSHQVTTSHLCYQTVSLYTALKMDTLQFCNIIFLCKHAIESSTIFSPRILLQEAMNYHIHDELLNWQEISLSNLRYNSHKTPSKKMLKCCLYASLRAIF
jgi:hypothetical protein